jgi:RNA polymerase sigma factor (sigma-70 family)
VEDRVIGLSVDNRVATTLPMTADRLCQIYAGRVYKFAQLIAGDAAQAEDLAQDALERAIRGLKTFDPARGDIEGWLWRIVAHAGRDAGRIASRQRLLLERLTDLWWVDEKTVDLSDHLLADEVMDAVRALSPRYRAVIALRYGADLSFRRVGQALGISEAAALMATRRALARLRIRLTQGVYPR